MLKTLFRIYTRLREAGDIRLVKAASGGQRSEIKKIDLDYYDIDQLIREMHRESIYHLYSALAKPLESVSYDTRRGWYSILF